MLITDQYKALNQELHARQASYGTSGQRSIGAVKRIIEEHQITSILDYGCGKCTLTDALDCVDIHLYDPAIDGMNDLILSDLVTCTDVMEHVEPELVDNVLQHLFSYCGKAAYFVICGQACTRTLADGSNAHRTVRSASWWRSKLQGYGSVTHLAATRHDVEEYAFLVLV
jgi:hypothetical protein